MAKKKNRNRQPAVGPGRYYRLFLYATLTAWGYIPPRDASIKQLKAACIAGVMAAAEKVGQWNIDPELPDSELSILLPALISRGVELNDAREVITLSAPSTQGGGKVTTTLTPEGGVSFEDAANATENWRENTAEWWHDTWSGDWESGWQNFQQGWNDFWSGNF